MLLKLSQLLHFLKTDIWRMRLKNVSRRKSFLLRQIRIILLAVRGFMEDKCKFRASALTFYSLLSVVPVIAMMFGIAKGFGLEKKVETELMQKMQGQEEVAQRVITFANSLLDNTSGGFIAGIGVAFLFWTIIKVLSNIENSFNDIWGVKTPRTLGRKFSDYLSMVLICPFLLIISSSANAVIASQIKEFIIQAPILSAAAPLVIFLLRFLPYCTVWLMFSFIFIFMPNTKVKFPSGIVGGIVAGTIFQITQIIYLKFQIGAAKYSAIYGSFAALPLFLLWLQISWLVILFGAELSFAHQNVDTYEFEQDCLSASPSFKKLTSLLITQQVIKNFCSNRPPWNADTISHTLEIPIRLVRQVLFELTEAKVLSEVRGESEKQTAYQPATDVNKITVKYVIESLETKGISDVPVEQSPELNKLKDCLNTFAGEIEKSPANLLLKNM